MLSYQHIYHAGNFADVQKHATLLRLVRLLAQKPQKFSVLDTHAGRGVYDLSGDEAQKTGEFKSGILPFWEKRNEASPLADYLQMIEEMNGGEELKIYPGSAKIAHKVMRSSDRLMLIEKHPGEYEELKNFFQNAPNVKVEKKDGFQCLMDMMPLPERRGLVLVDPSYEIKSEYAELPKQLEKAWKKWPQGQFMIWYPMLEAGLHRQMLTAFRKSQVKDMLVSEIALEESPGFAMYGTGVIVINPPFGFEKDLRDLTQYVTAHLPVKGRGEVFWLDNRQINPETGIVSAG